jgi:hypothetical protein
MDVTSTIILHCDFDSSACRGCLIGVSDGELASRRLYNSRGVSPGTAYTYSIEAIDFHGVPVFQCGTSSCVAAPMDIGGPTDTLVPVLYGTGMRNNSGLANVVAQIGGVPAQVNYAGANAVYSGFDQLNVVVPRSLAGAGNVPLILGCRRHHRQRGDCQCQIAHGLRVGRETIYFI